VTKDNTGEIPIWVPAGEGKGKPDQNRKELKNLTEVFVRKLKKAKTQKIPRLPASLES